MQLTTRSNYGIAELAQTYGTLPRGDGGGHGVRWPASLWTAIVLICVALNKGVYVP